MSINLADFIDDYLYELEENTGLVEKGILILKKDPENEEELNKIVRALHTIKGASRMLKFGVIEKISHGMENIYKGIREKRYQINKSFIKLTFIATDYLRAGIKRIQQTKQDNLPVAGLLEAFEKVYANEPFTTNELELTLPAATPPPAIPEAAASLVPGALQPAKKKEVAAGEKPAETGITYLQKDQLKAEYSTIRIKINKIDQLIKSLNNLIIKQFQLKKENDSISELEASIHQLASFVTPAIGALGSKIRRQRDECLKLVANLKKDFSEKIELIELNTSEVQEEIFSLRMLPLDLILDSIGKMVEETAMKLEKEVDLVVTGGDVMLDKIILEKINDPIIHLIRNAIDHGIESPRLREQHGKSPAGRIEINCYSESGNIIIRIKDDGQGLDYEHIRLKARTFAPHQEDEILKMSDENLNTFLFMPGFTTKKDITDLSGRGVGLDIVGYNIEKIKGKISLSSTRGKGTEFTLSLPLSLATVEGFFVSSAEEIFLIPANFTKELMIIRPADIFDLLNKKAIKLRNKIIPVFYLSSIIKQGQHKEAAKLFVVVVESLGEIMGIIVDSIIQYASLIYKPLPKNLTRLKAIQGIVFNESFNIINILYIPEIINKFKQVRNIESKKRYSRDKTEYKHVLIVDDSYSTREIEKSVIETEHFNVTTAVDGIDGLEKLHKQYFHLIITDINMPRMDGMLFLENIKRDEKYNKIPVIVISSENEAGIRQSFMEAGADAFIVKSEFDRNNLITAVKSLIG